MGDGAAEGRQPQPDGHFQHLQGGPLPRPLGFRSARSPGPIPPVLPETIPALFHLLPLPVLIYTPEAPAQNRHGRRPRAPARRPGPSPPVLPETIPPLFHLRPRPVLVYPPEAPGQNRQGRRLRVPARRPVRIPRGSSLPPFFDTLSKRTSGKGRKHEPKNQG